MLRCLLLFKVEAQGKRRTYISSSSSGITSIRFLPCPSSIRKGITTSRTNQCHSRSNSVQSGLNSGPAFSRSESRHFIKSRRRGWTKVGQSAVTQIVPPHKETYPIMSAPAVLIQRPSPNGFGGIGDSSKRTRDEENVLVGAVDTFGAAVEEFLVVVMVRNVGKHRERTKSR